MTELPAELDLVTLGRRVRHLRRARGLTLAQLAAAIGRAPSQLSLLENGRREPRLSQLQALAHALDVPLAELLTATPPSRRAALEIELERAQRQPLYAELDLPAVRAGRRLPGDALEALVGLHDELARRTREQAATPEEARRANADLRRQMRSQDNYYPDIERAAADILAAVGHTTAPLPQRVVGQVADHLGFTLRYVADLPHSTRSVTDLRNRIVYLPQRSSAHDPRTMVLQTLGHFVLGHGRPTGYADFLRQRVEANYFAAATLIPEQHALTFLTAAKNERSLAVEDLRDVSAVSYETAAHRFTNLATQHLQIPLHFLRVHENGTIYKAYENDGALFPTDVIGAIEGQPACRHWAARRVFTAPEKFATYYQYTDSPAGTYWCGTHLEPTGFSLTVGVPYAHAKWFRGRDTTVRVASTCPDPDCCQRPPERLTTRWEDNAWPSARARSHLLAALPPGTFPGVDDTEVYAFLDAHAP